MASCLDTRISGARFLERRATTIMMKIPFKRDTYLHLKRENSRPKIYVTPVEK